MSGGLRLFESESEVWIFAKNLELVMSAILVFVTRDAKIRPVFSAADLRNRIADRDKISFDKLFNMGGMMTIVTLVCRLLPNESCRIVANGGIKEINVDESSKDVSIVQDGAIFSGDVDLLAVLLKKALFDYYAKHLIEAKKKKAENLRIVKISNAALERAAQEFKNHHTRSGKSF